MDHRYNKYQTLITDIKQMLDTKDRGYATAQAMNDEMWEELGTHKARLEEQINQNKESQLLNREVNQADSVYEAARKYLRKFDK